MKTARRCKRRGHKVFRKDLLPLIPVHSLQDLHIYQPGEKTRDLARRLECSELAAAVLDSRVPEEAQCRELLNSPGLRAQLDALDMGRAAAAARALWTTAVPGKKVFVYGDYDVDGVSSTVLVVGLWLVLQHTPHSVTVVPPSEMTLTPLVAVFARISLTAQVETEGKD